MPSVNVEGQDGSVSRPSESSLDKSEGVGMANQVEQGGPGRKGLSLMDPEAWKKAMDPSTWRNPLDMKEWKTLANDPEKKLQSSLWSMKMGQTKQEALMELVSKLRATIQHAEEMLGKEAKISLMESYAPVMFIIQAFEEYLTMHPSGVRDIAIEDGARPVSKATLVEMDRYLEFAEIAYGAVEASGDSIHEFLARKGFTLVYNDTNTDFEMAAHYLAFNPTEKLCIVGIKGTSTMSDVMTDILCRTTPFTSGTYAHDGMKNAAQRVVHRIHSFMESLFAPLGYRILCTGHSLGAGVASLVGMILKEEMKIPHVRCYTFATPPVLDKNAAFNCKDYMVSVVNNRDVICRTSLSNMNIMHEVLVKVNAMLKDGKLTKEKIISLNEASHEEELNAQGLLAMLRNIQEEYKLSYEQDLYVPGRVIYLFKGGGTGRYDVLEKDGSLTGLRQMLLCRTMITDHLLSNYRSALSEVLFHCHKIHSVSSAGLVRGTPGSHISIDNWLAFRNPSENKSVTYYEIQTIVVRDPDALGLDDRLDDDTEGQPKDGEEDDALSSMFGFVNHVIQKFTAWRRYNDFVNFDSTLRASGMETPMLPSKFLQRTPEERAPLLEQYLRSVSVRVVKQNMNNLIAHVLNFVGAGSAPPGPSWLLDQLKQRTKKSPSVISNEPANKARSRSSSRASQKQRRPSTSTTNMM